MRERQAPGIVSVEPGDPAVGLPDIDGRTPDQALSAVKRVFVRITFRLVHVDDMAGAIDY